MIDLNDRIDAVKNKISGIPNRKKLKNFLGKLKPFLKFSAEGAALNKKGTGILKKLEGRSLIVTHTDLPDNKIVMAYKE